ncbi:MAG: 2-amino-4-hydroxy-6-hydroxymethyldihydropteridine diphosphokinase [Candidatus Aminicenantes bacterium]|nr:2-amino-4-hydroxy-6-hydroxymethyldihydropteridine diphosphokinase [Candidatus Aminicenantes bacterium]
MRYFLCLGSNTGDSLENFAVAAGRLKKEGIRIIRRSSIYKTEPVGYKKQPWFLNQAIDVESGLSPFELLKAAKTIETELGRKSGRKDGPRPIDIDILLAEDTIIQTKDLWIPHPRLAERRFALVPLAEIAPDAVHPVLKKTVRAILRNCPDRSTVERLRET